MITTERSEGVRRESRCNNEMNARDYLESILIDISIDKDVIINYNAELLDIVLYICNQENLLDDINRLSID